MKVDLSYTELLVLVDALNQPRKEELVSKEKLKELEEKLVNAMNGYGQVKKVEGSDVDRIGL